MTAAVVLVAPIVAGIIQAVTGFGAGIFMMIFFPMLFPILSASALSSSISLFVSGPQALRYRKHAKWKVALLPVVVYTIVSTVSIVLVPYLPTTLLKKVDIQLMLTKIKMVIMMRTIRNVNVLSQGSLISMPIT